MSYAQAISGSGRGAPAAAGNAAGGGEPPATPQQQGGAGEAAGAAAAGDAAAQPAGGQGAAAQPKLRFTLGGAQLAPPSTIFQAVQVCGSAKNRPIQDCVFAEFRWCELCSWASNSLSVSSCALLPSMLR